MYNGIIMSIVKINNVDHDLLTYMGSWVPETLQTNRAYRAARHSPPHPGILLRHAGTLDISQSV